MELGQGIQGQPLFHGSCTNSYNLYPTSGPLAVEGPAHYTP